MDCSRLNEDVENLESLARITRDLAKTFDGRLLAGFASDQAHEVVFTLSAIIHLAADRLADNAEQGRSR